MDVIEKIREIKRLGIPVDALSQALGATHRSLLRWESGDVLPRKKNKNKIDTLYRFAGSFNAVNNSFAILDRYAVFDLSALRSSLQDIILSLQQGIFPFQCDDDFDILDKFELLSLLSFQDLSPQYIKTYNFSFISFAKDNSVTLNITPSSGSYIFELEYIIDKENKVGYKICQNISYLLQLYISYLLFRRGIKHANSSVVIKKNAFTLNGLHIFGIKIDDIFSLVEQFAKEKRIEFTFLFDEHIKSYLQ
jgi:DNA-binding XRE family transcriptional regulator